MGVLTAWLLVAVVLVVLWLWFSVNTERAKILKCAQQIPGPRALPLIGNLLDFGWDSKYYFWLGLNLVEKYGRLCCFWLGPALFVLAVDPRDVEVVLSSIEHSQKSYLYRFFEPLLGNGLFSCNGDRWHKQRKLVTPAFHFKTLERSVEIFKKHGEIMVSKLMSSDGGYVDVNYVLKLFSQDVICDAAMGMELNSQNEDSKSLNYIHAVDESFEAIMKRFALPWYHIDQIYYLSPAGREFKRNVQLVHRSSEKIIQIRKQVLESLHEDDSLNNNDSKRRHSFLDTLLYAAKEYSLTDTDIRDEVNTFMTAGHDTSASALAFALYELGRNPDIQEKIYFELQEVTNNNGFCLTMKNLQEMKYLEKVIKECLRLYPSGPVLARSVTKELLLPSRNIVIPAGVQIAVSPMLLHLDPEIFPNPYVFNPENFTPEAMQSRHPFAYIPFSAGARCCIGQKFAMVEMKTVLAMLVWNFKIETDPKYKLELLIEVTLKSAKAIPVSFKPRNKIRL